MRNQFMKHFIITIRVVFIFCAIAIIITISCSTLHYYTPTFWTEHIDEPKTSCPDISGTYLNGGESIGGESFAYLYEELTKTRVYLSKECKTCPVEIHWLDDHNHTLLISIENEQGVSTAKLQQTEGDFSCENGELIVDYKIVMETIIEGRWQTGTRTFKHREDGSIVRKDQLSAFFHWLIIPFGFDVIEYAQWLPVEQVTNKSAKDSSDE
jgi:hypothetical protein